MNHELRIIASTEHLSQVTDFIEQHLDQVNCPPKIRMQVLMAVEEIYVNIAHYAYGSGQGDAILRTVLTSDPDAITITFADNGKPYNPLQQKDPDLTLPASRRPIGGLGIFLTKKFMDQLSYSYQDGQNIFTMTKRLETHETSTS